MPASGIEARIIRAKLCLACGYMHPRDEAAVDFCLHCGTRLDASTMEFPQALFEQPTVRASRGSAFPPRRRNGRERAIRSTRISGFPPAFPSVDLVLGRRLRTMKSLLEVGYVPQAEIWRINHGWRRSATTTDLSSTPIRARGSAKPR